MTNRYVVALFGATMLTPFHAAGAQSQPEPAASEVATQATSADSVTAEATERTTTADQAPALASSDEGEILVTAQRREERLVDVPITITSLSEARLETSSVRTVKDLPRLTSSVTVTHNGSKTQPAIRGVNSRLGENSVAIYVDGVYMPSDVALATDFGPGARVDVLKGPQGTLFGRNATGGAILITTPEPSFDPDLRVSVGLEERDGYLASFYGSTGITDELAFSLTANHRENDGWARKGDDPGGNSGIAIGTPINPQKSDLIRGKLLWRPSESVDVIASAEHGYSYDNSGFGRALIAYTGAIAPRPPVVRNKTYHSFVPDNRAEWEAASIKVEVDLGGTKLTSLSAYRDERTSILLDADLRSIPSPAVVAGYKTHEKTYSQEFILAGDNDRVDWVAGLFLYGNFYDVNYLTQGGHLSSQDTFAVAPFADVTFEVTDALSIIAGARFSYEHKTFNYMRPSPITVPPLAAFENETSSSNISPRLVVKYEFDRNSNVYASYSKGFKSGFYNVNAVGLSSGTQAAAQPVEDEELDAFEVGYKRQSSIFSLSTAAYYYNWKNIAVGRFTGTTTILQNAAAAEIYGIEADSTVNFTPDLALTIGGAYTHGRYSDFKDLSVNLPVDPANLDSPNTILTSQDITGKRLLRTPDFTLNASLDYTARTGAGDITFTAGAYYSSEFATALPRLDPVTGKQDLITGGFALFNASVLWELNKHFSAQVYVRNLGDKVYFSDMDATSTGIYAAWGEPRTFGLKLNYKL